MSSSTQLTTDSLLTLKAFYLGNEKMDAFTDNMDGADMCQSQIKSLVNKSNGKEIELSVLNKSLLVKYKNSPNEPFTLPICLLTYCGVFKQIKADKIINREFEMVDKVSESNQKSSKLFFVATFRNIKDLNKFHCFCFQMSNEKLGLELVNEVIKIYYDYIDSYKK